MCSVAKFSHIELFLNVKKVTECCEKTKKIHMTLRFTVSGR